MLDYEFILKISHDKIDELKRVPKETLSKLNSEDQIMTITWIQEKGSEAEINFFSKFDAIAKQISSKKSSEEQLILIKKWTYRCIWGVIHLRHVLHGGEEPFDFIPRGYLSNDIPAEKKESFYKCVLKSIKDGPMGIRSSLPILNLLNFIEGGSYKRSSLTANAIFTDYITCNLAILLFQECSRNLGDTNMIIRVSFIIENIIKELRSFLDHLDEKGDFVKNFSNWEKFIKRVNMTYEEKFLQGK